MIPRHTDALASSLIQAITAHDLSGMSAAKAHNFFCEPLCFLKVAFLDGSLYKAAFTCSQQRPGISLTTTAHRFCCFNAVKARHNVMQMQVKAMTTSGTGISPSSASQHILGNILLNPKMQATRQQDQTIYKG